ncbi:Uncharacterised protein [uncultured archaeon]|nr:Uncharacterised protein [uncultured archaeon]
MKLVSIVKEINLKKHLVDSTAVMTVATPVMAAVEKFNQHPLATQTSINSRLLAIGLTYAGFGSLFTWLRGHSRNMFGITPESTEKAKKFHDIAYSLAYGVVTTVPFYLIAGARGEQDVGWNTFYNVAAMGATGWLLGYSVDAFRDFFNVEPSERLPQVIQQFSPREKKGLAALAVTASLAITGLAYNLAPYFS